MAVLPPPLAEPASSTSLDKTTNISTQPTDNLLFWLNDGGFHGPKRTKYLGLCRELLHVEDDANTTQTSEPKELREVTLPTCPKCDVSMELIATAPRPSWREVFAARVYTDPVSLPTRQISPGTAAVVGGYG